MKIKQMTVNKLFLFGMLLTATTQHAIADDNSIGVGAWENGFHFLSGHNYYFRQKPFDRYGSGHARLQLGTDTGVSIRSHGGQPFFGTGDWYSGKGFMLGIDTANTHVNWTRGERERDFYNLMPGLSSGVFYRQGSVSLDVVGKAGASINNLYDKRFLHPDLDNYYGYQAILFMGKFQGAYDRYYIRGDVSTAWSVGMKSEGEAEIIYRQETNSYDKVEERRMIMLKWGF
jgi:hypothetical protein